MDIKCPSCYAYIDDGDQLSVGEIVYCSKCFKDFEVTKVKPIRLQPIKSWAPDNRADGNIYEDSLHNEEYYD